MEKPETTLVRIEIMIRKTDTVWLVVIPPTSAILILIIGAILANKVYPNGIPPMCSAVAGFLAALVASLSGFFQIIKREMPGPFGITLRGRYPVVTGAIWIAFCWALAVLALYSALTRTT